MLKVVYESLSLIFALCMGIYAFRYMQFIYRIFFIQLLAYILIYISGNLVKQVLIADNLPPDNQWVYNLYMPVETGLLAWAVYEYFKAEKLKYLVWFGYAIFLILFFSELFIKGVMVFSNHGYIAESVLVLLVYLLILYSQFTNDNTSWKRTPDLWICLGIVLFFGGVVPYLSLMRYLQDGYPKVNLFLFHFIIDGLSNVRYLLLAVGFWLIRRNALNTPPATHE